MSDPWNLLTLFMGGGLLTSLGLLYQARAQKRKTDADTGQSEASAASIVSETAVTLLLPLRNELEKTQQEADALRSEIHNLRDEVRKVRAENAEYHRRYGDLRTV